VATRVRIPSRTHYEHAVNALFAAVQEGRISEADADRLSQMIAAYEKKARR
jgi:hypothetical protein